MQEATCSKDSGSTGCGTARHPLAKSRSSTKTGASTKVQSIKILKCMGRGS